MQSYSCKEGAPRLTIYRNFSLAVFFCLLSGCISQEQIDADRAFAIESQSKNCSAYGFKPGTDGFANCMQSGMQMRQQVAMEESRRTQAAIASMNAPRPTLPGYQIVQPRNNTNCVSQIVGGQVYTNCR
jgi:hypothetical protein